MNLELERPQHEFEAHSPPRLAQETIANGERFDVGGAKARIVSPRRRCLWPRTAVDDKEVTTEASNAHGQGRLNPTHGNTGVKRTVSPGVIHPGLVSTSVVPKRCQPPGLTFG